MNFTITGITVEKNGLSREELQAAEVFSGKNAGICYMGDSYFGSKVSDPEKALKRFQNTAKTAHHSIADHVQVTVLLENCSKMLAILLNGLQNYATSEKSGRYTQMTASSEKEKVLYDKWKDIFTARLLELDPGMDDAMIQKECEKKGVVASELTEEDKKNFPSRKLAQENARYVLSVFTHSTTMAYSTSLRQWNYIYDWAVDFCKNAKDSFFETNLKKDLSALIHYIRSYLYVDGLRDTKNRGFSFLPAFGGIQDEPLCQYDFSRYPFHQASLCHYGEGLVSDDDEYGCAYQTSYLASFVQIAQAERHRTIKYFMMEDFHVNPDVFFVPKMIRETPLEKEWITDLRSLRELLPQATLVRIVETGHIKDFMLKCQERLCGRAQWEIMDQTKRTLQRFMANERYTNHVMHAYLEELGDLETRMPKTKCQLNGGCKEPCRFGCKGALNRAY